MEKHSDNPGVRKILGKVKFPFGKHKGESLDEILDDDPLYLDWYAGIQPGIHSSWQTKAMSKKVQQFVRLPVVVKIIDDAVERKSH